MIDMRKQYRTRDGREVKLLMTDGGARESVIGACKRLIDGAWVQASWACDGRFDTTCDEHVLDLIEVKPKHVRWVNCYEDCGVMTRAEADHMAKSAMSKRVACKMVEFEEGEGL
jgi:hypothetical protein